MKRATFGFLGATLALATAGCGGGLVAEATATRLQFTAGQNFNGAATDLSAETATTQVVSGRTVATVSSAGRTFRVDMPAAEIHAGDVFDIGVDGTAVTYTETRGSATYTWTATSGEVTIVGAAEGNQADIDVTGADFEADINISGNPARGAFTLDGNVHGIPITAGGGIGGQATLSFGVIQTTNATLSSFANATIVFGQIQGGGTLTATTGEGTSRRVLSVVLTQAANEGDVIDLTNMQNGKALVTFAQGSTQAARLWTAHAGTLTIVSLTETTAKVLFTNTLFTGTSGGASGAFRINGSLARR